MIDWLDELSSRRVVLFGGKGGVGKTTIAAAAALHYAQSRPTILFTTDPASNLRDLLGPGQDDSGSLTVEALDAEGLYRKFLGRNLESFLEIGDRGTYLDREELRRLFELALPGVDELMAWMRIGELAEEHPQAMVVVDTAPTGHTLRMLSSSGHFRQIALALDAMQEKHRVLVRQFTRRDVRDAMDAFIDDFDTQAGQRRALLTDPLRTSFVPVMLSEPLVVEQTIRLIAEVGLDVPLVVLNRAILAPDCARDVARASGDARARASLAPRRVVDAPRSCAPLDSAERLGDWSRGTLPKPAAPAPFEAGPSSGCLTLAPLLFFAGKGGVGKTSCSSSVALQLAQRNPQGRYVILSVDPAHSLRDVFAREEAPANLRVELVDTRAKWVRFKETIGREIENAMDTLAPRGMSLAHDSEAMQRMVEIAPPGADELFAITRLADLFADQSLDGVIVDTAPTGHFLRLLELPRTAGEWVREFMRILLHYREILAPGSLGEELVRASRALKELDATLRSERCAVVVVTRPERIVVAETKRLLESLRLRGLTLDGVIANYLTPPNDCPCEQSVRAAELAVLDDLGDAVLIERRDTPPDTLAALAGLVPL
ncbi:MAG: ArsA family ATPase [Acidobacteriota bacterium]